MVCGVPIISGIGAVILRGVNIGHVLLQVLTVTRHASTYTTQGNDARLERKTTMYVMTIAEAEYNAAHNDYEVARNAFYAANKADYPAAAAAFMASRVARDAAIAAWDAERETA